MTAAGRALRRGRSVALDPSALREWAADRAAARSHRRRAVAALKRIEQDLAFADRRATVSRPFADALSELMTSKERAVVFCPTPDLARNWLRNSKDLLGAKSVFRHLSDPTLARRTSAQCARSRRSARPRSWSPTPRPKKAATSSSPMSWSTSAFRRSANRLEQRIGRCDRWSPEGIGRVAVICRLRDTRTTPTPAPGSASSRRVSASSTVPSPAFSKPSTTQPTRRGGFSFRWGSTGVDAAVTRVREMLDAEIERVREQDALDSLETSADERSVYARIAEVESDGIGLREGERQPSCSEQRRRQPSIRADRQPCRRLGRLRGRSAACRGSKHRSR